MTQEYLHSASRMEETSALGSSLTAIRVDEKCHNEYYRAMRSGNIELLETLISKHSGGHAIKSQELEDILAQAYEELKLRNVLLTDEMELFVASKLLDLRFFETGLEKKENVTFEHIKERAIMVIDNINKLVEAYSGDEAVDIRFIFIGKCVARNIHILKRQLKSTYDRLPWEEIEFCLFAFISTKTCNQEVHCLTGTILTKVKILKHLEHFSNSLETDLPNLEQSHQTNKNNLPGRSRVQTMEDNEKEPSLFKELYNDYKLIRDTYSLETIKDYIEAVMADCEEKEGQLVIIRALQVIGENFKNTWESPKLSVSTAELLLILLPENTRRILTGLRDSLSHSHSLSIRTEMENNPDVSFFPQLKNDIIKLHKTINEILFKNKIKIIQESLKKIVSSENIEQMKELYKLCDTDIVLKLMSQNHNNIGLEKLESLTEKLSELVNDKTKHEIYLFRQIQVTIDNHKKEMSNFGNDYLSILSRISTFSDFSNNISYIDKDNIQQIKHWASVWLTLLDPGKEVQNLNVIINHTLDIARSLGPRHNWKLPYEWVLVICQINHFISYEMVNVPWVEKLKEKLDLKRQRNKIRSHNRVQNFDIDSKMAFLRSFLKTNGLSGAASITENISKVKSNIKFRVVIEALLLDILEILNSSKKIILNNILYFDGDSPLLMGKELRNHLAHGNVINGLLTFEHSVTLILNARKLMTEHYSGDNMKIGKLVTMNSVNLKKRLEYNLGTVSDQQEMFMSVAAGDVDKFNTLVSKGADIFGRSNDLWTTLHYSAKCSDVRFLKFLIDQKIPIDTKDIFGRTVLHIASEHGNDAIVQFLLEEGSVGIDDVDNKGKTALHLATESCHHETVKMLLEKEASTGVKDAMGISPLHWAVRNNFKKITETLLSKERSVDSNQLHGGLTPLFTATLHGHADLVRFFLECKANVNARRDNCTTPLHLAVVVGRVEIVESLIVYGAKVNAKTLDGLSPLHLAVFFKNIEVVEVLLKNDANVDIVNDKLKNSHLNCAAKKHQSENFKHPLMNGSTLIYKLPPGLTPLHLAAFYGELDMVHILIRNKCNINAVSDDGHTALHSCAEGGNVDIIKVLLEKEAKAGALDNDKRTPLHFSAAKGRMRASETLISKGVDINAIDSNGKLAFHFAAEKGGVDLVRMFIDKRTKIDIQDNDNMTPLHFAVQHNTIDVVRALLEAGADIHATENNGLTALHLAIIADKEEIAELLIEGKANIDATSKSGFTPAHIATQSSCTKLMNLLIKKGAKLDEPDSERHTPFCHAVGDNNFKMAELLLKQGVNVNFDNDTPLSLAAKFGYKDMVAFLLKNQIIEINHNNDSLHVAALHGHRNIVELLLEYGADINAVSGAGNETPLHLAVRSGHAEVVELLLNNSADVNMESNNGTPLLMAINLGLVDITRHLLDKGPHTQITNFCIILAVSKESVDILQLLLQHTQDSINTPAYRGFTILHRAAQTGNIEIVKYLIDKGADIHCSDVAASEPILIAAESGHKKVVEYFIAHNVSINVTDPFGLTLLHYAAAGGATQVVEYLINFIGKGKNFDVNVSNMNGLKPIHVACYYNCLDVVTLLLNNGAYYDAVDNDNKKPLVFTKDNKIASLLRTTEQLFKAVSEGDSVEVERCLKAGVRINAKSIRANIRNETGFTPLHYATECGHADVVKTLLSNGAIYDAVTSWRNTPLDLARDQQTLHVMKLVTDCFEYIQLDNEEVVNCLNKIEDMGVLKAVMNACNRERQTLIVAAIHNNFPAVTKLINISQVDVLSDITRARMLITVEKYQEASDLLSTALNTRNLIYGPDNPAILDIRVLMAFVLSGQQRFEEASDELKDVYIKQKYILGKHQSSTLKTRSEYAKILYLQGKNAEALKIFKKVVKRQKEVLKGKDLDLLGTQVDMAAVLYALQRYEEALEICDEVLIKYKQISSMRDFFHFNVQHKIAQILCKQKRIEEASTLYEHVYEGLKTTLGEFHSHTLSVLHDKIDVLGKNYHKALTELRKLYAIQENKLGPTHRDTLITQEHIGNILQFQGKTNEARQIFTETLAHRKEIFGSKNPIVLKDIERINKINEQLHFLGECVSGKFYFCQNDFNDAASSGNETLIQSFIDRGFEINAKDTRNITPLFYAVYGGQVRIVELLLDNGADVTVVTKKRNTPLHTAASKGNKDISDILLRHSKLVDDEKFNGFLDARTTGTGSTSLHIAANGGSDDIVKSLLEYGATYNSLDYNRRTPLDVASVINIVNLLKLIDNYFERARSGDEYIVSEMATLKADDCRCILNTRDVSGKTLLQTALTNKHRNIASGIVAILKSGE